MPSLRKTLCRWYSSRVLIVGAPALSTDEHRVILARLDLERSCRSGRASNGHPPLKLVLEIARELDDQVQLPLAKNRCDVAHDPGAGADRDPLADLERLLAAEMRLRSPHRTPELVPVVRHRRVAAPRPPRYAPQRISLVVSPARSTVASRGRRTTSRSAPRSRQLQQDAAADFARGPPKNSSRLHRWRRSRNSARVRHPDADLRSLRASRPRLRRRHDHCRRPHLRTSGPYAVPDGTTTSMSPVSVS
jgi:hypothetical protein